MLPAQPGQRVDPLPEIDRLDRHQNPHLRRDLDHAPRPQTTRLSATRSGSAAPVSWSRSRSPREALHLDEAHSAGGGGAASTSTNDGGGLDEVPDGYRAMNDREAIKVMVEL